MIDQLGITIRASMGNVVLLSTCLLHIDLSQLSMGMFPHIILLKDFTGCQHFNLIVLNLFFRRLKKVDPSTGLTESNRELKLDLYFQNFSGQHLHPALESMLR